MKSGFWLSWSCLAVASGVAAHASDIEAIQKSAIEWARMRSETVRLEADWQWQRQILASTNSALEERVHRLEAQRDELQAKTGDDRAEITEQTAKNSAAAAAIAKADEHLQTVATQLVQLRPALPPRLSQALELPFRSLANPSLSPGERMLYVTTILNRCAQFNKVITYGDEAVALPGESLPKLLNVIYWGLAQAYALDRVAGKAHVGAPAGDRWTWQESTAAVAPLDRVFKINHELADPDFVALPVRLSHRANATQP